MGSQAAPLSSLLRQGFEGKNQVGKSKKIQTSVTLTLRGVRGAAGPQRGVNWWEAQRRQRSLSELRGCSRCIVVPLEEPFLHPEPVVDSASHGRK